MFVNIFSIEVCDVPSLNKQAEQVAAYSPSFYG